MQAIYFLSDTFLLSTLKLDNNNILICIAFKFDFHAICRDCDSIY